MNGRLHDLGVLLTDLSVLGTAAPRCCWDDPATGAVCGEPATHFEGRMISLDLMVMHYVYRCEKHAAHDAAVDKVGDTCDDLLTSERVLGEARKAETREQILTILEREERASRLWHEGYVAYMEQILDLDHPNKVDEVNRVYRATVEDARRRITALRKNP